MNTEMAKKVMEAHIESKGLNYTRRGDGRISIPFDGFTIIFTARDLQKNIVSLTSTLDEKISGNLQLGVACKYAAKVNYSLNVGSVQIDASDGEITFYHAVPLEGMSAIDGGHLLRSW